MARRFIGELGCFFAAVAFAAAHPVYAGDRKGSASAHDARAASAAPAAALSALGNDDAKRGRGGDTFVFFPPGDERKESAAASPRERKSLTLLRFDSRFGEVSVEPVIGSVKGAQFSIGF
jgi:hypothetical protein